MPTKPLNFFYAKIEIDDTGKPLSVLSRRPVALYGMDMQCQTFGVDIGDRNGQELELSVGASYSQNNWVYPISLESIWAANHSAGSTGYLIVVGYYEGETL